jgi:hypothetical protein
MPARMKSTAAVYPLRLPQELDQRLRQRAQSEARPLSHLIADLLSAQLLLEPRAVEALTHREQRTVLE